MGSNVTDELADESFRRITEIMTVRGKAGAQFVRRQVATSLWKRYTMAMTQKQGIPIDRSKRSEEPEEEANSQGRGYL